MLKGGTNRSTTYNRDEYRSPSSRATRSGEGRCYALPSRDLDAENVLNRMTNVSRTLEYATYDLVVNIKKDNNIRNLSDYFDCLYVFATDQQSNALLNWVSGSFSCSIVSSGVVFTPFVGFSTTASTSYLTTNYIPSSSSTRFQLNNSAFGVYISQVGSKPTDLGFTQYIMTNSGTNPCVIAYFDFGIGIGSNGASSAQTGPATQQPCRGLISVTRRSSLYIQQQNKGLDINGLANSSVSLNTTAFTILARVGNTSYSTDTVAFAFIGSGDINIPALNRRIQEYLQAIGAQL